MPQLYTLHEKEKKNQYMNQVLQLEKGSFVSLVFTTTGGMSPEVKSFIRRIAVLIATKTNEDYSQVMCNIRTRLSMDIMRSVLVAVRGVRGKAKKAWTAPISNVSFNHIPDQRRIARDRRYFYFYLLLMIYDCALPIASLDLIYCIYIIIYTV